MLKFIITFSTRIFGRWSLLRKEKMDGRCLWIVFCVCCVCVRGEVFTALVEMENLVYREKEMIASVRDYLEEEEARLEKIREFTRKLDRIHAVIPQGKVENYLGHPTNAYLLIKRFVEEWPVIEDSAKNPSNDSMQ